MVDTYHNWTQPIVIWEENRSHKWVLAIRIKNAGNVFWLIIHTFLIQGWADEKAMDYCKLCKQNSAFAYFRKNGMTTVCFGFRETDLKTKNARI